MAHSLFRRWTRDGTKIGFTIDGLKMINVESTKEFNITRIEPYGHGVYLWSNMAWSPVDDRYLYIDFTIIWAVAYDLYIVEEGGESRLLVDGIEHRISPIWLLDGTGFIYVGTPLVKAIPKMQTFSTMTWPAAGPNG